MSFVDYLSKCLKTLGLFTLGLFVLCFANLLVVYYRVNALLEKATLSDEVMKSVLNTITGGTHFLLVFFVVYIVLVIWVYIREKNKITDRNSVVVQHIQKLDLASMIKEPSHTPRGTHNEDLKSIDK